MGRAFINNKIEPEDIGKLKDLHTRINPNSSAPDFGGKDTELMVVRDEDDPARIVGYALLERVLEVRAIEMDPNYELRQPALSHLFVAMETRIRCGDFGPKDKYHVSVLRDHHHVHRFFRDDGAVPIDQNATRYMKKVR